MNINQLGHISSSTAWDFSQENPEALW